MHTIINAYLENEDLNLNYLAVSELNTIKAHIQTERKVEAIKHLRDVTKVEDQVNYTLRDTNENGPFVTFLRDNDYLKRKSKTRMMNLKDAKDIVDFIQDNMED